MSAKGGGGNGADSGDIFIIVLMVAIFGVIFLLQQNFFIIAFFWKVLRLIELGMFSWIPDWVPGYGSLEIGSTFKWLLNTPFRDIMPDSVSMVDKHLGKWFSWIPASIMIYLGVRQIMRSDKKTNIYTVDSLLKKSEPLFNNIGPLVDTDPAKLELIYKRNKKETVEYGMALSPADFALLSPPLGLEEQAKHNTAYQRAIWDGDEDFDHDLAERAFKAQLGKHYTGYSNFSAPEKKLYDFLASKVTFVVDDMIPLAEKLIGSIIGTSPLIKDVDMSDEELKLYKKLENHLAGKENKKSKKKTSSPIKEMMDISDIEAIIMSSDFEKQFKLIAAERVMKRHSFVRVGLMSMLEEARDGGVVSTTEFRWLKGADRGLWYCMSTIGRRVSFSEAGGCFAHWLIERQIGRPLPQPEVTEAVEALFKALKLDVMIDS
ncbi:hypothetical protein D3C87_378560 [compost metagenome]